ncbi:MAG TPA: pyroglutamyl-peptidase I [Pseudolabrys sp.]|nr:pyroglutamyl-peptidase I [Pseudolabrys sp.]
MGITILVTGFGPFPGAPYNPTAALAKRVAQFRRPALSNVKIVPHVFPTSYAAVDHDLPMLIGKYQPDALLMFGLARRARAMRVETRARNARALWPDITGASTQGRPIEAGKPSLMRMPACPQRLLLACRTAKIPAAISRDAGRYVCNYLCWRAAALAASGSGPRIAAFIHIPGKRNRAARSLQDFSVAGAHVLVALAAAARR